MTGGAGFIGSYLSELLALAGYEVYVVDDLSTGNRDNLAYPLEQGAIELVEGKVETARIPQRDWRLVLHLAARPSPDDYSAHPVETMMSNSVGTMRALEEARRAGAIFFYSSTSEVYGHPDRIPTPETCWGRVNPVGPRSAYDESKRFSEALSMAYARQHGVRVRIARIFNTYGPRLDYKLAGYGRVVTKFLLQAMRGEPITVHGTGEQTRSFLFIEDNIVGLARMLVDPPRLDGKVINIGMDRETRIIDLARLVKKITGSSSPIVHTPPRPEDPPRRLPDITRARELLGWRPRVGLEEGLRVTYEWLLDRARG